MIHPILKHRLRPALARFRAVRLWYQLAGCWAGAACLGLLLLAFEPEGGWRTAIVPSAVGLIGAAAALYCYLRHRRPKDDWRRLAAKIEAEHPDLQGRLLTAVQQHSDEDQGFHYLQERLLAETIAHSGLRRWVDAIPKSRLLLAQGVHVAALAGFVAVLAGNWVVPREFALAGAGATKITVSPGDTTLERGGSLVVTAHFEGPLPARVDLVENPLSGPTRRIPLVKSLADPLFGGNISEVDNDLLYHIEYGSRRTRDFKVKVFEYPRLVRADAQLTYPAYTGLAPKRIEDTRRLDAVEGSRLTLTFQLNKAVAQATLVTKGKGGADIPLDIDTNHPAAHLRQFALRRSGDYALRLVDSQGRTNQQPAQFVFGVLKNRRPELRLTSPRGDLRPSPLEEVSFAGTVWDDFGVKAYGLAYTLVGGQTKYIELGKGVPAEKKRPFDYLLRLENLHVQPDQLIAWFAWAKDIGPDGKVRLTPGDLYFATVRPFEEIFRNGQSMSGGSQQRQSGQQNPFTRLTDLEKQIISATWNLHRGAEPSAASGSSAKGRVKEQNAGASGASTFSSQVLVVRDSQAQALQQAKSGRQHASDFRSVQFWNEASDQMEIALGQLNQATNDVQALSPALTSEQAAYQALLKLQAHEYAVNRSRNRQGGGRGQGMQRELAQLDLPRASDRYETARQAQKPRSAANRKQSAVLDRLRHLARRQQDINDRLKELQVALQQARTPQEREELRRRLKRLQEEEKRTLADVDSLRQQMDQPDLQSSMSEQRRQLEKTRNEIQRAASAAAQGRPSEALAAGTRAQRQLRQIHDDLRKQTSSRLAQALRQMRGEARDLARRQEALTKQFQSADRPRQKSLGGSGGQQALLDELARQQGRLTNLVEQAKQVSQQAQDAEPLVSSELYDTLRQYSQNDTETIRDFRQNLFNQGRLSREFNERLKDLKAHGNAKSLALTRELLRRGYSNEAGLAEARSSAGIAQLQHGIEQAAGRVLGDDTEALKRARQELDRLTRQLQKEVAQAGGKGGTNASGSSSSQTASSDRQMANSDRHGSTGRNPSAAVRRQANQSRSGQGQAGRQLAQARRSPQDAASSSQGRAGGQGRSSTARNGGGRSPTMQGRYRLSQTSARNRRQAGQAGGGGGAAGGDLSASAWNRLFNDGGGEWGGPITGQDFGPWSDRMRDVEDMVENPDLRNDLERVRGRVEVMRRNYKRDLKKPDWAVVRLQVIKPLVEVRQAIGEELARRQGGERLVPIDRDPVPRQYSELVRRYYEQLGKDE